jgi:nucleoside-diphosphate-sugar epimerase
LTFSTVDATSSQIALLTGGTGFVGSHVAELLGAAGLRVRCLVRRSSSLRYLPAGVETVVGDLASGAGLAEAVEGVNVVYHVAGVTKASSEAAYFDGNARGTRNLLAACERAPVPPARFVHVSSLAAAGPNPDAIPLGEDAPAHPLTWYGRSKLAGETAVRASALASRAVILRPPVVYGPRDTDVFEIFRTIARGFMLLIGRGESWFSYIHVDDLAQAIVSAGNHDEAAGGTFFIANPEPVTWTEFARVASRVTGRPVRFIRLPASAAYAAGWCAEIGSWLRGRPGILSRQKVLEAQCRHWTCDASRARSGLGFTASLSLREGIAGTLAWYKEAGWLAF